MRAATQTANPVCQRTDMQLFTLSARRLHELDCDVIGSGNVGCQCALAWPSRDGLRAALRPPSCSFCTGNGGMNILHVQSQVCSSDRTSTLRRGSMLATSRVLQQLDHETIRRHKDCRTHVRIINARNLMQEITPHLRLPLQLETQRLGPELDGFVQGGNRKTNVINATERSRVGHDGMIIVTGPAYRTVYAVAASGRVKMGVIHASYGAWPVPSSDCAVSGQHVDWFPGVPADVRQRKSPDRSQSFSIGGLKRNRTAVNGFAIRCIATLP